MRAFSVAMLVASLFLADVDCRAAMVVSGTIFAGVQNTNAMSGNARKAHAEFNAAVSGLRTIDFENFTSGFVFTNGIHQNINGVNGVHLRVTNSTASNPVISNSDSLTLGINTTSGGSKHLRVKNVNDLEFTFSNSANGITAFGAYISGLRSAQGGNDGVLTVKFIDKTSKEYNLDALIGTGSKGGLGFFGYKGDTIITKVTYDSATGTDVWGIDDFQFAAAPVPEPASLAMWGLGALGLVDHVRRLRRRLRCGVSLNY